MLRRESAVVTIVHGRGTHLRRQLQGLALRGYGGEDTDFAYSAASVAVPMRWVGGADAFHQYHPVTDPPVQHLHDIVRNAAVFYQRWGWWPMHGWLTAFEDRGLITRDAEGRPEIVAAQPATAEQNPRAEADTRVLVERAHPEALGAQQTEVDVGDRATPFLRETLRLREANAVLLDHGLPVPGQVGGGFAFPAAA